jgi:hypothetical protein
MHVSVAFPFSSLLSFLLFAFFITSKILVYGGEDIEYKIVSRSIPESCNGDASSGRMATSGDHLHIEHEVRLGNGTVIQGGMNRHTQLVHLVLQNLTDLVEDVPIHRVLTGMCVNSSIILSWKQGNAIGNLTPFFGIRAPFLMSIQEEVMVEMKVHHITSAEDFSIFAPLKGGNFSMVMELIDEHKGINAVDEWGLSPLMISTQSRYIPIISSLLNTRRPSVDINYAKNTGFTAIFYAIELSSTDVLLALLRRGIDPNAAILEESARGNTPLHYACMFEKTKHAEALLQYGANVLARNQHGQRPIDLVPRDAVMSTKLYFKKIFEEVLNNFEKGHGNHKPRTVGKKETNEL